MPPLLGLAHRHITSSRPNGRHQPHAERSASAARRGLAALGLADAKR